MTRAYNKLNIAIIGTGVTGRSCAQYLLEQGAIIHMFDTRPAMKNDITFDIEWGEIAENRLLDFDLVVVSPGVSLQLPAIQHAQNRGVEVVGDVEIFARENQNPVIAITGSNGKSTVVSLLGAIFEQANVPASVIGNIGTPVLQAWQAVANQPEHWLLMELSSFQLESTSSLNAQAAVILNISEDHLDRHVTMTAYESAKKRIFKHANHCIVNRSDAKLAPAQTPEMTFGLEKTELGMSWDPVSQHILYKGKPFVDMHLCHLKGEHNVLNIQAASLLALTAGIAHQHIVDAVVSFTGLPHRFQRIGKQLNAVWINDSKATNPGAALASIDAARHQTEGRLVVILGGDAKGVDLDVMHANIQQKVDYVVALGRDGRAFLSMNANSVYVDSMQQAVDVAAAIVDRGDTVLLAPACASLDMFKNFEQRGDSFAQAVEALVA